MSDRDITAALQPQDLVLTILGAYGRGSGEHVWSGGMVGLLRSLGFSVEAARAALARLAGRDLLARHKDGRLVYYTLTSRAHELLAQGDRRIFTFGRSVPTPDMWTTLWHALPESRRVERARLAARLRFLGFGSVQDATWVAASDREPEVLLILRELQIEPWTSVLIGRLSRRLPPLALIEQAWDLDAVCAGYRAFIDDFGRYRGDEASGDADDATAFVVRTLMLHRYRAFPAVDPELPPSLVVSGDGRDGDARKPDPPVAQAVVEAERLRSTVVETFDEVFENLRPAAKRHFDSIARPAHAGAQVAQP